MRVRGLNGNDGALITFVAKRTVSADFLTTLPLWRVSLPPQRCFVTFVAVYDSLFPLRAGAVPARICLHLVFVL